MSPTTISAKARAYARNDLRVELSSIAEYSRSKPEIVVPTALGDCFIPRGVFFHLHIGDLYWAIWPRRRANWRTAYRGNECAHCKRRGLSEGVHVWCRDCELDRAIDLPEGWPRCERCALAFPTCTAGFPRHGAWVTPAWDGSSVCECCQLEKDFGGDADKMISARLTLASKREVELRRHVGATANAAAVYVAWYAWSNDALGELLRLHRVSVAAVATVILRETKKVIDSVFKSGVIEFRPRAIEVRPAARRLSA